MTAPDTASATPERHSTGEAADPTAPPIGWWGWTWRCAVVVFFAVALYVGVRLSYEQLAAPLYAPVPAMTVGHDTTRIDGPLDEHGYVDYIAALEEQSRRGVTPEENGAAAFYQIIGPKTIPAAERENFFRRLGIALPPENGNYLGDPYEQKSTGRWTDEDRAAEERRDLAFGQAGKRPRGREEFPEVAAWIDTNSEALDRLIAASRRPRWYVPIHMVPNAEGPLGGRILVNYDASHITEVRRAGRGLAWRAMLRAQEGNFSAAWEDAEAIDRLGAQVGQGPVMIEWLMQIAMHGIANSIVEAVARDPRVESTVRAKLRERHRFRPTLSNLADRVDRAERFMVLDCVRMAGQSGGSPRLTAFVDWNEALRQVNPHVDALVGAMRVPDLRKRRAAVAQAEKELDAWTAERTTINYWALAWLSGESARTLRGRGVGFWIMGLMLPAVGGATDAEAMWRVERDGVDLTFALAEFHGKHGRYPLVLSELVPEHVQQLPDDLFAPVTRPMTYLRTADGYVLFSDDAPQSATAPPEPGSHAFSKGLIFRVPWQDPDP